ncbi:zinc ABC transporter substrate-binding protein [Deinococcus sp.]|uniref:metal ABC transporter solute-binding protein, Zn/Mn family n=1 Tax=Deinococcus sp. TaxID=47478 RepID=UPI0025BF6CA0|nr:zinc ABC transporter substrate-binding protein [Deinococcus sp.]
MKRLLTLALLSLTAAQAAPLQVSATNTVIADFVKNVGGNRVSVNTIVAAGGDTHTFQPTTGAIRGLAGSKVIFANGAGLEPWLPRMTEAVNVPVQPLTAGLKLRLAPGGGEEGTDPHAWWDAGLATGYARNVADTLTRLDPAGRATYQNNLKRFVEQISSADGYAKAQFAQLPTARKTIVTNHDALHYFAARYGLKVVGTVIPGLSTEREPSAQDIAKLVQNVKKAGVKVIFTENTVNARLAQTLAQETGAKIAPPLFTDALGPAGSGGETYLKALKYNVDTMVKALR